MDETDCSINHSKPQGDMNQLQGDIGEAHNGQEVPHRVYECDVFHMFVINMYLSSDV